MKLCTYLSYISSEFEITRIDPCYAFAFAFIIEKHL